jgi:methylated-DNA-protein-cysteine methyltransferase-like protein
MKKYDQFWLLIRSIPRGKVATYGQISEILSLGSARLVGKLLHNNPDPSQYPCHRVVFADGSQAKNFAFGGATEQKRKLEAEGVLFKANKVDLKLYLWK